MQDAALLAAAAVAYGTLVGVTAAARHAVTAADVRDWLTAIGVLVGAVGAAAAAVIAARAYRLSTEAAKQVAADRHREHASKFSVWAEPLTAGGRHGDPVMGWHGFVHNSSDEPMYHVQVIFRDGSTDPPKSLATAATLDVLPPGQTREINAERVGRSGRNFPRVVTEARFNDRAGARWYRDWRGGLVEKPHAELDSATLDEPTTTLG